MRAESSRPSAKAAERLSKTSWGSEGNNSMSFPACSAKISRVPGGTGAATPAMPKASVITRPSNWSVSKSKSRMIRGEREVGNPVVLSSAGTERWAVMTPSTPPSIKVRKGGSSVLLRVALSD